MLLWLVTRSLRIFWLFGHSVSAVAPGTFLYSWPYTPAGRVQEKARAWLLGSRDTWRWVMAAVSGAGDDRTRAWRTGKTHRRAGQEPPHSHGRGHGGILIYFFTFWSKQRIESRPDRQPLCPAKEVGHTAFSAGDQLGEGLLSRGCLGRGCLVRARARRVPEGSNTGGANQRAAKARLPSAFTEAMPPCFSVAAWIGTRRCGGAPTGRGPPTVW